MGVTSDVQCLLGAPSAVTALSDSGTAPASLGQAIPPRPPKGTRWGGRAKGTPNKVNQSIREAIQMAFEQVGGRRVPDKVGAGGSEDVRAAAHQDDASGT